MQERKTIMSAKIIKGELVFSEKIREISKAEFSFCKDFAVLKIPDGVIKIGEGAFLGCYSMVQAELPDTISEIGIQICLL